MTVQGLDAKLENKRKYNIIKSIIDNNKEDRIIILGDMNGHTGILGEPVNANGQKLLDFCDEYELEILNHTIMDGKVTWRSKEYESAIDYAVVNTKASERIKEARIDENGTIDIDTDHNSIVIEYQYEKPKIIS